MPPRRVPLTTLKHAFIYVVPAAAAYIFFAPNKSEYERKREIEHRYHDKVQRAKQNNKEIFKLMRNQNSPEHQRQFDTLLRAGKGAQPKRHYELKEPAAGGDGAPTPAGKK